MSGDELSPNLPDWLLDIWDDFLDLRSDLLASGNLTAKEKNLLGDVQSDNCKAVFLGFLDQRLNADASGCPGSSAEDEDELDLRAGVDDDGDGRREFDRNGLHRSRRAAIVKGGDEVRVRGPTLHRNTIRRSWPESQVDEASMDTLADDVCAILRYHPELIAHCQFAELEMRLPSSDTIEIFKHLLIAELCEALKLRGIQENDDQLPGEVQVVMDPMGLLGNHSDILHLI